MASRLDGVKQAVDGDISDLEALQDGVQRDKTATGDLLEMGKVAQQVLEDYGNPVQMSSVTNTRRGGGGQFDEVHSSPP